MTVLLTVTVSINYVAGKIMQKFKESHHTQFFNLKKESQYEKKC